MTKRQLFLKHVGQTSDIPMSIEVEYADGVYIYANDGKKYLDFDSGISVSSLGHGHPHIVKAVQDQAAKYMHTMVYGEHIQNPQVEYAQLLTSQLDSKLDNVFFVNTGTEAVEASMKLARKFTGRYEIIAASKAYHGSTLGSDSLRSDIAYTSAFTPMVPGIYHIDFNNEEHLERITERTACVILEPVQAEAGIRPPINEYLKKLRQRCDAVGALLVLDEIQTGFGRTGYLFAHQKYEIVPDVLLIAKAMGGGMPIGALVSSKDIMMTLARNPMLGHITTFGGHPVCVAACKASLEILLGQPEIIMQVIEKEKFIRELLKHPKIKSVRSSGLMMAVELVRPKSLVNIVNKVIEKGVLVDYFLFDETSFRIAPPLIITKEQLAEGIAIILDVLQDIDI
jgi:acetylornithine/succinyldiaminopimelate/putrescine aminotransferase